MRHDLQHPASALTSRRDFIREAAVGLGGALTLPAILAGSSSALKGAEVHLEAIGVQLYTVRDEMKKNVDATLARVAQIGYREVEFAGYFDKTPSQIVALLKSTGLRAPSSHISLNDIRSRWPQVLDIAAEIGHGYLVCAYIEEKDRTLDSYNRIVEDFNRAGEQAKAHKITFAYHNHDFEFKSLGDTLPYDLLLSKCDAKLVKMELDLYWINKAGHDPLVYFAKYPGRFPLVHLKDMKADGAMASVGEGRIPFATYFAQAKKAGIKHYFVEHDNPGDAFASIERSFRYLKALKF
ncbi:MAG: sugar phosphate isomerase/epimerase [Gemmatimonadaceae bacterium]